MLPEAGAKKRAQERVFQSPNPVAACQTYILQKETRAVNRVFLQRVMEVTTDGADAARQPTDTQYWFIPFFQSDRGAAEWLQLSGGGQGRYKQDLNILTGSGLTEMVSLSLCCNAGQNT